jgi:glutaredoxin
MGTTRILQATACAALLACALGSHAQQTIYKWVDKDGKVQFSDSPPPPDATNPTQKTLGGGTVTEGQTPYATQIATQRYPVTLYMSDDCGELCAQGREYLGKRGIPFSEKNAKDKEVADELKALIGALQVPVLKVGSNQVKGYSEELWANALDQAGYARGRLPGQVGSK